MKTSLRLTFALAVALTTAVVLGDAAAGAALDGIGNVRLKGRLGETLDRMIENCVAERDVDYITACFLEKTETKGWWQAEFWGKYMHAAVPYAVYSGSPKIAASIRRGVERVLASQEPCGYIGNYPDALRCGEGWDVWGMKYTMMGLMHYYDWVKGGMGGRGAEGGMGAEGGRGSGAEAKKVLEAVKKLCDYVIGEIGPGGKRGVEVWQTGNWSGLASSSILEPVVWLYRRVAAAEGEAAAQKYLDFATFIVKGMIEPKAGPRLVDLALEGVSVADRNGHGNVADTSGSYVVKNNRWKAYEMMSCYQGLLDYVEVRRKREEERSAEGRSGDVESSFKAAVMTARDIAATEVNLAGGCASSEAWYHGATRQHESYERVQETCVTTTWMRLCERLLAETDDPVWADYLERAFYNAYLGSLKADGSEFEAYTPLSGTRWSGMDHCYMHTDCCTANGPRGFLCFLKKFFVLDEKGATFNFYSSALANAVRADGQPVAFEMYSRYPRANYVRIVSHTQGAGAFPLRLRIPAWSAKTEVKLNGEAQPGVRAGAYVTLEREWKLGDIVEVTFDMPVVAHVQNHFVAYTRGPVLLARDSRFDDGDLMEPLPPKSVVDGEVMTGFAPTVVPSEEFWMAFSASLPLGQHKENQEALNPTTVFFCDFASAGNRWSRKNYYRTWFPVEKGPAE